MEYQVRELHQIFFSKAYLWTESECSHHKEKKNSPERCDRHCGKSFWVHDEHQTRTCKKTVQMLTVVLDNHHTTCTWLITFRKHNVITQVTDFCTYSKRGEGCNPWMSWQWIDCYLRIMWWIALPLWIYKHTGTMGVLNDSEVFHMIFRLSAMGRVIYDYSRYSYNHMQS